MISPDRQCLNHFNKSFTIGGFPFIEPESLFIQVAEEGKGFHTHVGSLNRPLQQRPEVFNPVGVDVALHVGLCVVHEWPARPGDGAADREGLRGDRQA